MPNNSVLTKDGLNYFWEKTKGLINSSGGGSPGRFESSTTTFRESNGVKTITQTFVDRTLVTTIQTLSNGNTQIVEVLTDINSGSKQTKTTIINKTTKDITETVS